MTALRGRSASKKKKVYTRTPGRRVFICTLLVATAFFAFLIWSVQEGQPPRVTPADLTYPNYENVRVIVTGYMATAPRIIVLEEVPLLFPKLYEYNEGKPSYSQYHWQLIITTYADGKGQQAIIFLNQDQVYTYTSLLQQGAHVRAWGAVYYTPQGALVEPQPYLIAEAFEVP